MNHKKLKPRRININKTRLSRKQLVLAFIALILCLSAGGYIYDNSQPSQDKLSADDCVRHLQVANELLQKSQPQQAYEVLIPYKQDCATPPGEQDIKDASRAEQNIAVLNFNATLARTSYLIAKNVDAQAYARTALEINAKLTTSQLTQIPNAASLYSDMYDIGDGVYNFHPELKEPL